jgi:tripartite-type tricarboxylate transporter receptor subunit TctC
VVSLAITSTKRSPTLPDVPTFAEAALPNYASTGYVGIMTTAGTPADIVQKLNTSINEVIHRPEFAKRFSEFGYEMVGGSVAEFSAFLKEDIARYLRLTKAAGIQPE